MRSLSCEEISVAFVIQSRSDIPAKIMEYQLAI
ncbi:hypothetical protein SFHH103_03813 [Sinorhizobium fredii HH103]|uniref:Uncharacterized protein n=1 Tax=Sinorhizobium fredii (strain HH103) TaxID=1117943 RepID=G9A5I3_SINF1|nr:hypothetical protein SFHH103_03813 [Sinorhizobium fredii HH103]